MNEDLYEFRPFYYNICENNDEKEKGFHIEITGNSKIQDVIMKQSLLIKKLKESRIKYLQIIEEKNKEIKGMGEFIKKYESKDTSYDGGNNNESGMINGVSGESGNTCYDSKVEKKICFDDKSYDEKNADLKEELNRLSEKYRKVKNQLREFDNRFNDIDYVEIEEENTIFNEVSCQTDESIQEIQQSDESREGVSINNERDLLSKIKQLESELQTKSNKIGMLSEANDNLVKKENEQENRDKEYKKMIDGLYEQIKKYQSLSNNSPQKQKELEDIKNEMLSNKDKQINELKQEIQNLSESKMKDLSESRRSILISKEIEDQSKEKDKKIEELKDSLVRKNEQNVKKIEEYEIEMERMKENHDYAVKHYVETINRLESKVSGSEIEYVREEMKVAIEQKDKLIDGLEKELEKIKSGSAEQFSKEVEVEEIKRLNRECETKQDKINELSNKIIKLELRIQELHQLKEEIESPIKSMHKQNTNEQHKIIANLKEQIEEKNNIERELQKLRKANTKLTRHLEKVEFEEESLILSEVECQTDLSPIEEPTQTILMTKNSSKKNTIEDSEVGKARIEELELKLAENEKLIESLTKENEVLARDNDLVSENVVKLSEVMNIKSELEAKVEEYEKSSKLLEEENKKLVDYKNKEDEQLATNFEKIEQLEFETSKIREALSEKEKEYKILKEESEVSIHQMGITIGEKETLIQNLKKEILTNSQNNDKLNAEITKLKQQIEEIKESQETESKELKTEIERNKNVANEPSEKDKLINSLQTNLSKSEAEMSKIVTELKMQIEDERKRESEKRRDHDNELAKIKRDFASQLSKKEEQIKEVDLEKEKMNSELKRLSLNLKKAEDTQQNELKNIQEASNREINNYKETISQLETEIKSLKQDKLQYESKLLNSSNISKIDTSKVGDQQGEKDKLIRKLEDKVKKLKKKEVSLKEINNRLTNDLEIVEFEEETLLMNEVQCQTDFLSSESTETNKELVQLEKLVSELHFELDDKIKTIGECKTKIKALENEIKEKSNVKYPNYVPNGRQLNFNEGETVTYSVNKSEQNNKEEERPLKSELDKNIEKLSSPQQILNVFKVPTTEPQTDSAIINRVIKKNLLESKEGENTNILQIEDLNNIEIIFVERPLIRDELVDYDLIQPALILKQKSEKSSPEKGE